MVLPVPVALIRAMWIFCFPLISVWFHQLFFLFSPSGHSTTSNERVLPQGKWISFLSRFLFVSTCTCIFLSLIVLQDFKNTFLCYICIFLFHFIYKVTVVPVQGVFRASRFSVLSSISPVSVCWAYHPKSKLRIFSFKPSVDWYCQ